MYKNLHVFIGVFDLLYIPIHFISAERKDYISILKMSGYRPVYTVEEDNTILKMIVDTEAFYCLTSKNFWVDLHNSGYFNRTWQSLKERFEKQILPNIMSSDYTLSLMDKRRIQIAYYQLTTSDID